VGQRGDTSHFLVVERRHVHPMNRTTSCIPAGPARVDYRYNVKSPATGSAALG
jgi:hypothetical protein